MNNWTFICLFTSTTKQSLVFFHWRVFGQLGWRIGRVLDSCCIRFGDCLFLQRFCRWMMLGKRRDGFCWLVQYFALLRRPNKTILPPTTTTNAPFLGGLKRALESSGKRRTNTASSHFSYLQVICARSTLGNRHVLSWGDLGFQVAPLKVERPKVSHPAIIVVIHRPAQTTTPPYFSMDSRAASTLIQHPCFFLQK